MIVSLAGQEVHLTKEGLAWLPGPKILAAADLHFEKASFFSRFGTLLPPYDSVETLLRLEEAIDAHAPARFIALGDSFHDKDAGARMDEIHRARLNALINKVDWIWITGNHDPAIDAMISGRRADEVVEQGIVFRHRSERNGTGAEISGHFHPKAAFHVREHYIRGPCFVQCGEKLVLPAFGTFTGGLDVKSAAFSREFPVEQSRYFLLQQEHIFEL